MTASRWVILLCFTLIGQNALVNSVFASSSSIVDSGKSSKEIAAEILRGARERYAKEQQQEQEDKRESSKVIMYSTSWCGYCRKARNYFKAKNIPYIEYDIERSLTAKRDYDRLGGNGVPLIVVGKNRMSGFSKKRFNRLYQVVN